MIRVTSQTLQASVSISNVRVHDSGIRKRLNKCDLLERAAKRKPLLSKKNRAAQLRLAKSPLNKPQDFWNNVFCKDYTKMGMVGFNAQHNIQRKPNTVYQHKHLKTTVKHSGGGLMMWACFAATRLQLACTMITSMPALVIHFYFNIT